MKYIRVDMLFTKVRTGEMLPDVWGLRFPTTDRLGLVSN